MSRRVYKKKRPIEETYTYIKRPIKKNYTYEKRPVKETYVYTKIMLFAVEMEKRTPMYIPK